MTTLLKNPQDIHHYLHSFATVVNVNTHFSKDNQETNIGSVRNPIYLHC